MAKKLNVSEKTKNEVIELYKHGESIGKIGQMFNKSPQTISRWLKIWEIKPKNHVQTKWVNENYFDNITTEEQAYLLGFFIADGCIREENDSRNSNWHSTRLCFSNSVDDEEIINLIHNRICPNNKLIYVHNTKGAENRKPQITLQWTAYNMVDILKNKYKILPRKTYDLEFEFPFETIPKELWRHFVRGFMDGDGSINYSELRFAFTSFKFMNQIINIFKDLFDEYKDVVWDFSYSITEYEGKTCKYWTVFIPLGHGRGKLIKNYLYKDCTVYLKRKYNKAFKNE